MNNYIKNSQTTNKARIETPEDAETLCSRLIDTTADLISVLERETHMVRNAVSSDFSALSARKQALSITLMQDMETLKENSDYIKSTTPEQITILQEQQSQFHRSLEINHSALTAMKAVSEELLHTIATKVAKKKAGPELYNQNAGFSSPTDKSSGPVSLDATL